MGKKLNLGCGIDFREGYLNVDKFGDPELKMDMEVFPWPWEDDSVSEIVMHHVLEHLGKETDTYLGIMKELYRASENGCRIHIAIPHPRHDTFINDPTHVRPVTPESLGLFSQKLNQEWIENKASNSLLGVFTGVDFEIINANYELDDSWIQKLNKGEIGQEDIHHAIRSFNNVVKSINIELEVIKPGRYKGEIRS
ncbi:MAG: hypothetical protein NE334_14065 [Lentisphaeraceae bacterium]|nr:hypothetical protein [Lentisphaeraceae bacterium]